MRILIVGGNSNVGMALEPVLSQFAKVITAGRNDCNIHLNLSDLDKNIILPDNIDVIIHTAANIGGNTDEEIMDAEIINVLGTLKLCQAAAENKVKHFVLISSMFATLDEKSPYYGIYSLSKKHSEDVAKFYCDRHSLPLTIIRPSQIYGDSDNFKKHQPFLYDIIDKAEKGEEIVLWGHGRTGRNYLHINDLVGWIKRVIQDKVYGALNCIGAKASYLHIAKTASIVFAVATANKSSIITVIEKEEMPECIFIDKEGLNRIFPVIAIGEGIRRIAEYRQKNKK
jgi:UDP-glucose 4-epimerase